MFVLSIGCVNASDNLLNDINDTIYVSGDGNDLNNGLTQNSSFKTIDKALNVGNSDKVIYIGEGNYSGKLNTNLSINSSNIYLIGEKVNKTIIDGDNLNRLLVISSNSNVVLINLTFINGHDLYKGGAIFNSGNLTLINCTFLSNTVSNSFVFKNYDIGNEWDYVYGAAIYNEGYLNIKNSYFVNNILGSANQKFAFGGAVASYGKIIIDNSLFDNNVIITYKNWNYSNQHSSKNYVSDIQAFQKGGAIFCIANSSIISNSVFNYNKLIFFENCPSNHTMFFVYSEGGAIYFKGNNWSFTNCSFLNNAADVGGAIYFEGNNTLFDSCNFEFNSAYLGCAILSWDFNHNKMLSKVHYIDGLNKYYNVFILNSSFRNNYFTCSKNDNIDEIFFRMGYGAGACYLKLNNIMINNSIFESNGMIYSKQFAHLYQECNGGALYLFGNNSKISNSLFKDNYAEMGGAISSSGFNNCISNSSFLNNFALSKDGGAICNSLGNIHINNSNFTSNFALKRGGGVYSASFWNNGDGNQVYSTYENSKFINNVVNGYGGAIDDSSSHINYKNLEFVGNVAYWGGAVYSSGNGNIFNESKFINNIAKNDDYSNGGAIFSQGSDCEYLSCVFLNNSANLNGGAIYSAGNNIYCVNSFFNNNHAFKGGAIWLSGSGGKIQNNTFNSNGAIYGGAIYTITNELIVDYNLFKQDNANISGGAIYNGGINLTLYSNSMFDCVARLNGYGYGHYIFTTSTISYLVVSFLNDTFVSSDSNKFYVNVTDNFGNPITGGNVTFVLYNELSGETIDLGIGEVIEGFASVDYSKKLDYGEYYLMGSYSYAANPILLNKGNLLSVKLSKLNIYYYNNPNNFSLGNNFTFYLTLVDLNGDFIPNAEIKVYENGVYSHSLITDNSGFVNSSFDNLNTLGTHYFNFVYNGDLIHSRTFNNLSITIYPDDNDKFKDVIFFSYYPIVIASVGDQIPFEFFIGVDGNKPLFNISTLRYFSVYKNGELIKCENYRDYLGKCVSSGKLYNYKSVNNLTFIDFLVSDYGEFCMPIIENESGVFVYTILFNGGLIKQYNASKEYLPLVNDEDYYYNSANVSVIVIINQKGVNLNTKITTGSSITINEVQNLNFTSNLSYLNGTGLDNKKILVYNNGNFVGSFVTDNLGVGSFKLDDTLNKGEHIFELVFAGDSENSSCYTFLTVNVVDNPDKIDTFIYSNESVNNTGRFINISGSLADKNGNGLVNESLIINIYSDNILIKNFTIKTNNNGLFSFNWNFGAGNFIINYLYNGNKLFSASKFSSNIIINKIETLLIGVSSLDVVGNESYLTWVLVDNNYNILTNSKININFYSKYYNVSYVIFTNESGVASLKLDLPVGYYQVLSKFEGDKWYGDSAVLTEVSIHGDKSVLKTNPNLILKEKGNFYVVHLTDSVGNPLVGETVIISINGVNYTKITDNMGRAFLKISLNYGKYMVYSYFKGNLKYSSSFISSNLLVVNKDYKIPSVLITNNSFTFKGHGMYNVVLRDMLNNPLSNENIIITVNGKVYNKVTNDEGCVSLDIGLATGHYIIKSIFNGNNEYHGTECVSDLVIVDKNAINTILNSSDYLVFRGKGNLFNVTLLDENNNPLINQKISFTVNGVTYNRITNNQGVASLTINLNSGSYDVYCKYLGSEGYFTSEFKSKLVVINYMGITTLLKYSNFSFIGKGQYKVCLLDENNNPLMSKNILFTINGVVYTRSTDENGVATININLREGIYSIYCVFSSDGAYKRSNSLIDNITVYSTILANNLIKYYCNDSQFYAHLVDVGGNPLKGVNVSMNINGVFYVRCTDENGVVKLNINLNPGFYILTVYDPYLKQMASSYNITVLSTLLLFNTTMMEGENTGYDIYLFNGKGEAMSNSSVIININGVFYTKTTDNQGFVRLNINLNAGNYIATVVDTVTKLEMSTYINILKSQPVLSVPSKILFEGKGNYFKAKLTDYDGVKLIGEIITISVNNVSYVRMVDSEGFASLKICLMSGEYIVTCNALNGLKSETILEVK